MKKNNKLSLKFLRPLAVALVLSLSVPVIASAEGSSSGGGEHSGGTGTSGSTVKTFASTATDETSGTTKTTDRSLAETRAHDLMEQFKRQGTDSNSTDRTKHPEKSEAFREKACDARKTEITKRMANSVTRAAKIKAKMDAFYAKVKKFHDDKSLTTPGYDALVANVDAAGATVDANIAALKALNVEIDCSKTNVADSLSAFRAAVKATRDSLKSYRSAIVDLVKAVHQSAESSTTESTQSNTNNQ